MRIYNLEVAHNIYVLPIGFLHHYNIHIGKKGAWIYEKLSSLLNAFGCQQTTMNFSRLTIS